MRVTQATIAMTLQEGLNRSLANLAAAQGRLSSGKRINRFSDAPLDAANTLRIRSQERDLNSYKVAADDALSWLNTQDQALQSVSERLTKARDLALQGANSVRSQGERDAIAQELVAIRDQIATMANTTYLDRSVFAGFAGSAVQLVAGVWTWVGDTGGTSQVNRRVAPQTVMQVNLDGENLFGFTSGNDVFQVLDTLAADIQAGNVTAVMAGVNDLDARTVTIRGGLGMIGTRTNQLETIRDTGESQIQTLRTNRSELEDADLAQSVLAMSEAEVAYQAALGAAARLTLPSLLDFLR